MSEETFQLVLSTINKLENIANTKAEIDQLWLEVKSVKLAEMSSLPELPSSSLKSRIGNSRKATSFGMMSWKLSGWNLVKQKRNI